MLALACLIAWLLGGIPFGLVLVRVFRGVDIRTIGSGNVGATNASRAFTGRGRSLVFFAIYLLDFAKGCVPALTFGPWLAGDGSILAAVLVGAAAILGHCFSPFLGLRGGKGVATTTGVFAAVEPLALLVALATFGAVFALTRRVFVGSLALGVALALATVLRAPATAFGARLPATTLALAAMAFLFWTHRSNLRAAVRERRAAAEVEP
ncbi:MAG: glycerol-3-phosphate acyltransferase [Planctomycetes bacterium]|nr:glycerol-3-phosphate acyltransferase [Planctomycetota bacterium]